MGIKRINIYITKVFFKNFLKVCFGFSLLIAFINFFEISGAFNDKAVSLFLVAKMSILSIPDFLESISPSLILISAIITIFNFSSKSEITVMRSAGFSLWNFIRPIAITSFVIGVFWVAVVGPMSIRMLNKLDAIEREYDKNDVHSLNPNIIEPRNGIWLKQINGEGNSEEILINARNVHKDNLEFNDVSAWFFNKDGQFYKKMNIDKALLEEKKWVFKNVILNDSNNINSVAGEIVIPTEFEREFIAKKVVSNFQNEKLFSVYELPNLIKDLSLAGFLPTKFMVHYHSLLNKPFLFVAMAFLACYFGVHSVRSGNSVLSLFLGIISGLLLYIISAVMIALGSSGLISIFAATWIITIICLSLGIILVYRKEFI